MSTTSEIVERLNELAQNEAKCGFITEAYDLRAAAARLDELEREGAVLREALESITARYVDLASSGNCGFWDCEQEDVVKQARAALKGEAT
jgi:hypothetical protein